MIRRLLRLLLRRQLERPMSAERAYALWAERYDEESEANVMLALGDLLLFELLDEAPLEGRRVLDIGCGTGRSWDALLQRRPAELVGVDASPEMLARLRVRHPEREAHLAPASRLPLESGRFDVALSLLTLGYLERLDQALVEWRRVVAPGGRLSIVDAHPAALDRGMRRTFALDGRAVAIRTFVHRVSDIERACGAAGLELVRVRERGLEERVRGMYERKGALSVYEEWKSTPLVIGYELSVG